METDTSAELESLKIRLGRKEWVMLYTALSVLVFFSLLALCVQAVVPKFEPIFSEMLGDAPLPGLTRLVFTLSQNGIAMILAVLVPLAVAILLILKRNALFPWVITLVAVLLLMFQIIATVAALVIPLSTIMFEMNA